MAKAQGETQLQKAIARFLGLHGVFCWVNRNSATYDRTTGRWRKGTAIPGISDILGILPGGRFLAIEVKMPKKYPTPEQRMFLADVNRKGGLGFVARSIDDAIRELGLGRTAEAPPREAASGAAPPGSP